jgi:hypothetical protein
MNALKIGLLSAALFLPAVVLAHGEKTGPNGGVVEDAGKYHVELVMKADELRAFVTGAGGAKVDTKGAEASATVLVGREKLTLKLLPAGGNALAAGGKFDTRAGAKVVLSLALPGQPAVSGRFSIPAKK